MEFRDAVKLLRGELGITQVELANALHINYATVGRWENGRTLPMRSVAEALVAYARTKSASDACLDLLTKAINPAALRKQALRADALCAVEHASLRRLIDDASFPIYVSDIETGELLYANAKAHALIHCGGAPHEGHKCYECLMHSPRPCSSCHKTPLRDDNFITGSTCFLDKISHPQQGKLIKWNGRRAQVRYMTQHDVGKQLKSLVDSMSGGVRLNIYTDEGELKITYSNDLFYTLLGCTRADCEKHEDALPPPLDGDAAKALRWRVAMERKKGETQTMEYEITRGDGQIAYLREDISFMAVEHIHAPIVMSVLTDVSAFTKASLAVNEHQKQIKELLNSTPGGIAILEGNTHEGLDGLRAIFYNDSFIAYSGYTRQEYDAYMRQNNMFLLCPESTPALVEMLNELQAGEVGVKRNCTILCRTKDGTSRYLLLTGQLTKKQGDQYNIYMVQMDITPHKIAQDNLRIRDEMLRIAADANHRLIFTYDIAAQTLSFANHSPRLKHLNEPLQNVPDSLPGLNLIAPDSELALIEMFDRVKKGEHKLSVALRLRANPEDEFEWFECNVTTISDANGKPAHAVFLLSNITDKRIKEGVFIRWQQLIRQRDPKTYAFFRYNLSKNARLDMHAGDLLDVMFPASCTSFARRTVEYAAHYVFPKDRPEYSALMNADLLLSKFYRGEHTHTLAYREMDDNGAPKWRKLTLEMVEHPHTGDVHAFLMYEDIDKQKQAALKEAERSQTDPLTGLLNRTAFFARVDPLIKQQANARHALLLINIDDLTHINQALGHDMGDRALKSVAATLRSLIRHGNMACRLSGDEFLVWLKDIPYNAVIEKIARQICEQARKVLSDEISLSVSVGIAMYPKNGGSFDELYYKGKQALHFIKRAGKDNYAFFDPNTEAIIPIMGKTDTATKRKNQMLIVDDSANSRMILEELFKDEYTIHTAKNGTDALLTMHQLGSTLTIVLLDLFMPGMDGFDVLYKIQSNVELRTIPVIVVSGSDEREMALNAIEHGAADYVTKPVDADLLRLRVKSAVSKAENEHLRAQNSYLRLHRDEELKYRTVLESTGTVVVEYNQRSNTFLYDNTISRYLSGVYDNPDLWAVFRLGGVADSSDVKHLKQTLSQLIRQPEKREAVRLVMLKTSVGDKHWFRVSMYKQPNDSGAALTIILTFNDVHVEILADEKLRFQATMDELTGLYNRAGFIEKATQLISEHEPGYYVLSCIDIERFKIINDQYGTKKGDEVLRQFGQKLLKLHSEHGSICCRVMADNFAVLYPTSMIDSPLLYASHKDVQHIDDAIPPLKIAIGRCIVDDKTLDVSAIYDRAILAKETIKNRYDLYIATYDESMRTKLLRQQEIIGQMRKALEEGQFEAWLQPQFNHATGKLSGAEALVRWRHPTEGVISPGEFIPIFERNGFVYEVDKFVWEEACKYLSKWLKDGLDPVSVSVNVSRYDVFRSDIIDVITGLVKKYELPPALLRLEITESAFSENTDQIIRVVEQFVALGFVVEIDDFGNGYSSLNTLKDVPAQVLKMDMRFIESGKNSSRGGNIVESIVRMAKWLDISIIAEGVETIEQADYLKSIGCNYVQGFLYSRPQQVDEYEQLFKNGQMQAVQGDLTALETWNNSAFWDPKSMDSLIFNSYVGGAAIFEYTNDSAELLRCNDNYAAILEGNPLYDHEVARRNIFDLMGEKNRTIIKSTVLRAINDMTESTCEISFPGVNNTLKDLSIAMRQIANAGDRSLIYAAIQDVSQQRQTERERHATSQKLEAIMNHMEGGVAASVVREGKIHYLFANRRYYEILGYTKEEYDSQFSGVYVTIHPDDKPRVDKRIHQATLDLKPYCTELRIIRKDGDVRWLNYNATIVHLPEQEQEPVHLVTISDITAIREAQQVERRLTAQLRAIMTNIGGGVSASIVHEDGAIEIIFANDGFYEMLGYTSQTMASKTTGIADLVHPLDRSTVLDIVQNTLKTHTKASYEYRCLKHNGDIIWVRTTNSVISLEGVSDNVLLAVSIDVTNLHQAHQTAQNALEKLRVVLDSAQDGITAAIVHDDTVELLLVNKKYYELLGESPDAFQPRNLHGNIERIHPKDRDKLNQMLKSNTRVGQKSEVEYRIKHPDGTTVWIKSMLSVINISGIAEPVQVAVYTDITAQKEMTAQFRFLNETAHRILAQPNNESALRDTLSSLLRLFDADRSYIVELDYHTMLSKNTFEVCADGIAPQIDTLQSVPFDANTDWFKTLKGMNCFIVEDVSALGDDWLMLKRQLQRQGVNAIMLAPLWRDGEMIGFSGIDNPKASLAKPDRILALSDYISILLTRRDLQAKLAKSREQIQNLPQQLLDFFPYGAALYEYDGKTISTVHINRRYWQLVERDPVSCDKVSVLKSIHPDDVKKTVDALEYAVRQGCNIAVDIRIRCGKAGFKPFHVDAVIEQQKSGKVRFYVAYSLLEKDVVSIQETLLVALKVAMNTSTDISYIKDRNLRYLCASKSLINLFDLPENETLAGKCADDIYPPEFALRCNRTDKQVLEHGDTMVDEYRMFCTKNGQRHLLLSKYPILDANGSILGIFGIGRDVTQARSTQSRLEALTNNIPGGIAVYNVRKSTPVTIRLSYFSDGVCRLLGYTREAIERLSSQNAFFMLDKQDEKSLRRAFKKMLADGTPVDCIYRIKNKADHATWITIKATLSEPEGDEETINVVLIDATEQKRVEERLRISAEEFLLATRHSNSTICRYTIADRTLTFTVGDARRVAVSEVVTNVPYSVVDKGVISPETTQAYITFYESIIRGQKECTVMFRKHVDLGWRWISAHATTMYDDNQNPVSAVISFMDVTDLQEKEAIYQRWQQVLSRKGTQAYTLFRCNLSENRSFDSTEGTLLRFTLSNDETKTFNDRTREFAQQCVCPEDQPAYIAFMDRQRLLDNYFRGEIVEELEFRGILSTGETHWLCLSVELAEYPNTTDIAAYLMFEDIDLNKTTALITKMRAERDSLTGLLNRDTFIELFKTQLPAKHSSLLCALLIIDVDGFKHINDTYGHITGDKVLTHTGRAIKSVLRDSDMVGRLGGDEYIICLSAMPSRDAILKKAQQICAAVEKNATRGIRTSISLGIAVFPEDGDNFERLYHKADKALYFVKAHGKNGCTFYTRDMESIHQEYPE